MNKADNPNFDYKIYYFSEPFIGLPNVDGFLNFSIQGATKSELLAVSFKIQKTCYPDSIAQIRLDSGGAGLIAALKGVSGKASSGVMSADLSDDQTSLILYYRDKEK